MTGKLTLVATPIGNLGDMSERALEALREADLIAAEDTRNTVRLLNHFEIKKPMTSYHEFNKIDKAYELCGEIKNGKNVALVTDAGMPAVSDPGEDLVRIAYESGIAVTIVPGPCAAVCALALSGLPTRRFAFEAFLPADKTERAEILDELKDETRTVILYEAPHRLLKTLTELIPVFGEERRISIVRELTKIHEEVFCTTLKAAAERYAAPEGEKLIRGEYVLVIEGKSREAVKTEQQAEWNTMTIAEHVALYEAGGTAHKEAMRLAAKDRGISRREVYQALLNNSSS
jgi:16S rRNA (cytidine1402-2'-O)-methyltransferase